MGRDSSRVPKPEKARKDVEERVLISAQMSRHVFVFSCEEVVRIPYLGMWRPLPAYIAERIDQKLKGTDRGRC